MSLVKFDYDSFKEKLHKNYSLEKIKYYYKLTNIDELYKELLKIECPINYYTNMNHFKLSFLIHSLNFENYMPLNNGELFENSINCKYTLATITNIGKNENLFIKSTDLSRDNDDIKIDIISCILFEYIYNLIKQDQNNNFAKNISDLSDYVAIFKGAIPSFTFLDKWNYNTILNQYNIDKCYIIHDSFNYKKKENYIYITNSVNNPDTIITMINNFQNDIEKDKNNANIIIYLNEISSIYNFIYYYGSQYGYLHNDLHSGNLLLDTIKNKIIMIDYGQNSFGYFYENNDEIVNGYVKNYYKLLNNDDDEITYKNMIDLNFTDKNYLISIIKSLKNNSYMTYILDLITLSLNLLYSYRIFIQLKTSANNEIYKKLTDLIYFEKNPNNTSDDILSILYEKEFKIKMRFLDIDEIIAIYISTKTELFEKYKTMGKEVLWELNVYDGLFYTALLFHNFKLDGDCLYSQNTKIFYKNGFQMNNTSRLINQISINHFMQYLQIINERYIQLQHFNSFFYQLNNAPGELYKGGDIIIKKPLTNTNHIFTNSNIEPKLQNLKFDDLLSSFNDNNISNSELKIIIENISHVSNNYIIDIIQKIINKDFKLIKTDLLLSIKKIDKIKTSKKEFNMDIKTQAKKYNEIFKYNMQQSLYKKETKGDVVVVKNKSKSFIEL
jgi:hypothetical protein